MLSTALKATVGRETLKTPLVVCMGSTSQVQATIQTRSIAAANADLTAQRNEFHFKLPKRLEELCLPLLQDKRDLPILHLFFNIAVTVLPAALALYCLPAWSAVLGPAYMVATDVLFLERYLLALHYSQHRPLFKTGAIGALWHMSCWHRCNRHRYSRQSC